jgi:hypothetical protein
MVVLFVLFLGLSRIRIVVMEIEEKTKRNQRAKRAMPALASRTEETVPFYSLFQFHHDLLQQQQQQGRMRGEES